MDIVQRASENLRVSAKFIFRRAVESQHFTNEEEVYCERYARYVSNGEIPPYVRTYCRETMDAIALAVGKEGVDFITRNGERQPLFV